MEKVKEDLQGWRLIRYIFIADAEMTSEDTLAQHRCCGKRHIIALL